MIVLVGRPVRDRRPAATEWRLIEYDAAARVPVADRGSRWEPAGHTGQPCQLSSRVTDWAAHVLGHPVTLGPPAEELAGPGSWHLRLSTTPEAASRSNPRQDR